MILIIDDEPYIRSSLSGLLTDEGYQTTTAASAELGEAWLEKNVPDLILLDIQMPGKGGLTFLDDNRRRLEGIPVIIISGRNDIPTAVSALKLGAIDYIEKPLSPERVLLSVKLALRQAQAVMQEQKLTRRILDQYQIIGQSVAVNDMRRLIAKAAQSDATVLITGENGVGKELVARQIHFQSTRKTEPLVIVNCPAIPETLFEAELFGHLRGAFTGATAARAGRFEAAGSGTLFLDEIGDLPLPMQGKLLRVLESGQFEKVGADKTETAQCRLVAATNRDLKALIADGKFREDLYYRLNVVGITVPPLRERPEDIPLLTQFFLAESQSGSQYYFSPEAVGRLTACDWPGNIRQLKNIVHQIMFACEPGEISAGDVDSALHEAASPDETASSESENRLAAAVHNFEYGFLVRIYQKHQGNIASAARELGMDRGNLSKKLRQLGIV